jgi:UDP-N-acetylmuramoylalanine--D-glutamate ligase
MKIALLGYGVEGQSAYEYLSRHYSDAEFVVYDEQTSAKAPIPEGVKFRGGVKDFHDIDADLVMRTPPIAPDRISTRGKISSTTALFFEQCPAPIIGVTGSKGKGTISSLIAHILQTSGKTVHLVGNIGVASLAELDEIQPHDIVVFEMSSFQLWDMQLSPKVAVVGMIEPDHLDIHASFEEYIAAKQNIARWQTTEDAIVYHPTNQYSEKIAQCSPGKKVRYATPEGAYIRDDNLFINDQKICSVKEIIIPGQHNLENICAALTASWVYVQDVAAAHKAITTFKGLPHRIEFVRELNGVKYYDDSFASAPSATVVAVQAFVEPKIVILGGYDKKVDLEPMVKNLVGQNIKKILLIGQTGPRLAELFRQYDKAEWIDELGTATMETIVQRAKGRAAASDIVLLSPSCASFDMFRNFKERGEQFQAAVNAL